MLPSICDDLTPVDFDLGGVGPGGLGYGRRLDGIPGRVVGFAVGVGRRRQDGDDDEYR